MNGIKIVGTGCGIPDQVITNGDLAQLVDTSDSWIVSRTGIRCRRRCGPVSYTHLDVYKRQVKALVVRGTGAVKIARPLEVKLLSNYMIKDLVGGNNNHNVPTVPQSWAEYSATTKNRWQGGPGVTWDKAPNGPVDTGEQPSGIINVAALRCNTGVFDFGAIAETYTVKQGGCSSCPVRCYTEYALDPLADYDLPTHVSNTCMPITAQVQLFNGHEHDFVDEGDASIVLNGAGSRFQDDYGVWCNYGNVYTDFVRTYADGIFQEHMTDDDKALNWQYMEDGDPRWLGEFYRALASGLSLIHIFGEENNT